MENQAPSLNSFKMITSMAFRKVPYLEKHYALWCPEGTYGGGISSVGRVMPTPEVAVSSRLGFHHFNTEAKSA